MSGFFLGFKEFFFSFVIFHCVYVDSLLTFYPPHTLRSRASFTVGRKELFLCKLYSYHAKRCDGGCFCSLGTRSLLYLSISLSLCLSHFTDDDAEINTFCHYSYTNFLRGHKKKSLLIHFQDLPICGCVGETKATQPKRQRKKKVFELCGNLHNFSFSLVLRFMLPYQTAEYRLSQQPGRPVNDDISYP